MIHVTHLTRRFPGRIAVDDVSFHVARGEIVGFLGPNGAGKTTTMRMITGYIPPTGGGVRVAGFDVTEEPMQIRRRIGYLPEHCPLYPEMRVNEYLRFRARLKGVTSGRVRSRLDEVKQLCGLEDVGDRIIGQLSKGFRQRVGLAESLIHDPELLILDEPTIGLDPNQIRQVRELITNLSQKHTILLSTHILPEVEATCRRVLIIHNGKIVASDTTENLHGRLQGEARISAEIKGPREAIAEQLRRIPAVSRVSSNGDGDWGRYELIAAKDADPREEIYAAVVQCGWALRELKLERQSLEDVFVALTRADAGKTRG